MKILLSPRITRMLRIAAALPVPAIFVSALLYKISLIEPRISHLMYSRGYCAFRILQHDLPIFSTALLLFYLCATLRNRAGTIATRLGLLLLIAVYLLDIAILRIFACHAVINDIMEYAAYTPRVLTGLFTDVLTVKKKIAVSSSILLGLAVIANFLTIPMRLGIVQRRWIACLALAGMGLYLVKNNDDFCHTWSYQNVFEYNTMIIGQNRPYSRAFEDGLKTRYRPAEVKRSPKIPGRKNIIIVILESISPYHSRYFSALNNVTPNIDKIAEENVSFHNFFSNGFTTEDCLISVLTGLPPISAPAIRTDAGGISFEGFFHTQNPLPKILKEHGYTCEFLTTGDLSFSNKEEWLAEIGFDRTSGHNLPFYKNWKHYQFNAAPDQALYERTLERIFDEKIETPYFVILETVSGHAPYINPENDACSEMETMAYVDKQVGLFYERLKKNNFFESGMLILVSDHRSMTPLRKPEIDLYGMEEAPARVPLILCFGGAPREKEYGYFQQTDLYSSLINYVSDEALTTQWQGDLISKPRVPPEFIIFKRGDVRNDVSIFQKNVNFRIRLNGDRTRFWGRKPPDPDTAGRMLDKINGERIQRQLEDEEPAADGQHAVGA